MMNYEKIIDRLPSLYRPQPEDTGFLSFYLQSIGNVLDRFESDMQQVLLSHWFPVADRAIYNPYFKEDCKHRGLLPYDFNNQDLKLLLKGFAYVTDLAKIGSLLALSPWREPISLKEGVEAYRERLSKYVMLYRSGLGTVDALRTIVTAELPEDIRRSEIDQERPFRIEEKVPYEVKSYAVSTKGDPAEILGPLMRWQMRQKGIEATTPTVYIQGQTPIPDDVEPAVNPMIELVNPTDDLMGEGIAYEGNLTPDQTLKLSPAYACFLGHETGLLSFTSIPKKDIVADRVAAGPWSTVADSPDAKITSICRTQDHMIWAAINVTQPDDSISGTIWQYNGRLWQRILTGETVSKINTLAEDGKYLWVGTDTGLAMINLYPEPANTYEAVSAAAELDGIAVYAILKAGHHQLLIGTENGTARVGMGSISADSLGASDLAGMAVFAIHQDTSGVFYYGTNLGLFQYQTGLGHWYFYCGESQADNIPDWNRFTPGVLPNEANVFLPSVKSICRGPDKTLWIGTEKGFARYLARPADDTAYESIAAPVGYVAYTTVLEAYPDFVDSEVYSIERDHAGQIWFCTGRGLFRFDGQEMNQYDHVQQEWIRLGKAQKRVSDEVGILRGSWRYARYIRDETDTLVLTNQWQYFDTISGWINYAADFNSLNQEHVFDVLWSNAVMAELGTYDGSGFTASQIVDNSLLRTRIKPRRDLIHDGGIASIPELPAGTSSWRYLSMEPPGMVEASERPSWTQEGRLLLPLENLAKNASPFPGRYNVDEPVKPEGFDFEDVFAYLPAAKVWFEWQPVQLFTAIVRLLKRSQEDDIDPAIIDRVWQGIQRVRPAGLKVMLAVEQSIVRGG